MLPAPSLRSQELESGPPTTYCQHKLDLSWLVPVVFKVLSFQVHQVHVRLPIAKVIL